MRVTNSSPSRWLPTSSGKTLAVTPLGATGNGGRRRSSSCAVAACDTGAVHRRALPAPSALARGRGRQATRRGRRYRTSGPLRSSVAAANFSRGTK
jgi:hypothetical protein